ncbi:hypothetical protein [Bradyrhizobium erythrophlei]|uniref:Uncharacterized protein n=1 Tax=Bradyrhizobium erythrophlei TaxID=1437360 RepID=A0A1H4UJD8_9BRAD|nr:hypothetical protein [Bradyrhizobium erythrophlei]SEC68763.1 hypothetical protein SAMN05444164_2476 [Bradyrhizobium erythrophlei]
MTARSSWMTKIRNSQAEHAQLSGEAREAARIRVTVSLEAAMSEVDAWLDETKLKTGKCSRIFRQQLAEAMSHRTTVFDEIGQLEGSDPPRPTGTKGAAPLTRGLTGLMHKHYRISSVASFAFNQKNHWRRKEKRPSWTVLPMSPAVPEIPANWCTNWSWARTRVSIQPAR